MGKVAGLGDDAATEAGEVVVEDDGLAGGGGFDGLGEGEGGGEGAVFS